MATSINFPALSEVNYPVTSVNGMTGAVTIKIPVESVNGKTGAITLSASDIKALPDTYVPPVTSVNGKTGEITLSASDVKAATTSHTHGRINSNGAISGVTQPMLLITDSSGNIIASRTFGGDITVNGTITANKIVGAVYA